MPMSAEAAAAEVAMPAGRRWVIYYKESLQCFEDSWTSTHGDHGPAVVAAYPPVAAAPVRSDRGVGRHSSGVNDVHVAGATCGDHGSEQVAISRPGRIEVAADERCRHRGIGRRRSGSSVSTGRLRPLACRRRRSVVVALPDRLRLFLDAEISTSRGVVSIPNGAARQSPTRRGRNVTASSTTPRASVPRRR